MKKIIIIALSLFILVSCWEITENKVETNKKIEIKNEVIENNNPETFDNIDKKVSISDIKNNLTKLESINIDSIDLNMINTNIELLYNNKIELEALKINDIKICEKISDEGSNDSCKKRFFIAKNDIKWCDLLKATDMQRICKNNIIEKEASKTFNEKLCEKMIFQKQENPDWIEILVLENWTEEIQNCKNRVLIEKSIFKKNINICENISNKNEVNMCKELVKMEIENKKREEEMKIQDELLKIEEEKNRIQVPINKNLRTGTGNTNLEF